MTRPRAFDIHTEYPIGGQTFNPESEKERQSKMSEATTEAAPKKTRKRRSFADRKRELAEKLAKLEAQAAKQELEEAIKSGECADPEAAKKLNSQLRALQIGHRAYVDLGLVKEEDYQKAISVVSEAMEEAVHGKEE